MQDIPNIQQFHGSPLGGFVEFLNEWERMKERVAYLEGKLHGFQKQPKVKRRFFSLNETCDTLNLKQSKVRELVKNGQLKRNLDSRHLQISVESVDNYIRQVLPL